METIIRLIFALALVPVAVGTTMVLSEYLTSYWSSSCFIFFIGILSYTMVYPIFKKPILSYVIGHELTHVIGIWLFRGRVHGMKVSKRGGLVSADRSNVWIRLGPYFFPIYTVLVLGIYLLISIAWDISIYHNIVIFILGFTWAFHLWMTIHMIMQSQPDIHRSGVLFSLVIVYMMNLLVLTMLIVFILPEVNCLGFISSLQHKVWDSYLWIVQKLV